MLALPETQNNRIVSIAEAMSIAITQQHHFQNLSFFHSCQNRLFSNLLFRCLCRFLQIPH